MTSFLRKLDLFLASGEVSDFNSAFPKLADGEKVIGTCSRTVAQLFSFIFVLRDGLEDCEAILSWTDPETNKQEYEKYIGLMTQIKLQINIVCELVSNQILEEFPASTSLRHLEIRSGWLLVLMPEGTKATDTDNRISSLLATLLRGEGRA